MHVGAAPELVCLCRWSHLLVALAAWLVCVCVRACVRACARTREV